MDDYSPRTPDEVRNWLRDAIEAAARDKAVFGWAIELKETKEVVGWIGFEPIGVVGGQRRFPVKLT